MEPDSGEVNENNIIVTPPLPKETDPPKDPIDLSKYPQEWVDKKDLLKKICRDKVPKKVKHKKMCRKWKDVIW